MAKILLAEEWAEPSPVAIQLQYDLPEEYLVISDPTVQGRELDAVVVGPQGLFVLHRTAARGRTDAEEDEDMVPLDLKQRISGATGALKGFLRDEFPGLSPKIHHLLVANGSPEEGQGARSAEVSTATLGSAAEEISSVNLPTSGALLDGEERQELAVALRDRKLTVSQRASQPFIFRSGDVFGSGTEVWTIKEAVRHMAAHPESGIYHLRNGTLAAWLYSEGAIHLARAAQDVIRTHTDRRAALETFLIETGLVDRPRLQVRPKEVDLGYLTAGDEVTRRIRVGKGSGRGYLFGTLDPSVPWLSVYPRRFSVESGEKVVSVLLETESLPIGQRPSEASILVHSNGSREPLEIPVRFRVVGTPSTLNRTLLRPAAGGIAAGLLGAGIGGLLTVGGAPGAGFLAGLEWLPLSPAAVWVVAVTLLWAVLGAMRGASQPEAWPISYATGRWLFRTLVWVASLTLAGAACLWCWGQLRPGAGAPSGAVSRSTLLIPMALAILPATVGEIRSGPRMRDTSLRAIRWSFLRPFVIPLVAIALALAAALGAPQLRPVMRQLDLPTATESTGEWIETRLVEVGERLDDIIDRLYLRYYDRRAPGDEGNGGS